ncbi:uncharacterized protein LOC123657601 [Melitaea cinxia]|uniref:uncharacterized protein LOC123657601 n=1 Tax=Melitaea cinxia TaxID=113334 RepID=UPI001E2738B5|nr:uncharacterized protein LOC123657601 [Melitaea cinxia]
MHNENGQAERYCRTILNMIRVEVNNKNSLWSDSLWRIQLVLNCTQQKTTRVSPMQLLIGIDGTTPVIRSLIRDVAINNSSPNREAMRELHRQRASELMERNKERQDAYVNKHRRNPRIFKLNDFVFVSKSAQARGKLDSGMRGPYRVVKILPHGRYELQLLGASHGKTTRAAAEYMTAWHGEWTPESCAAFFNTDDTNDPEFLQVENPAIAETMDNHSLEVNVDVHLSGEAV